MEIRYMAHDEHVVLRQMTPEQKPGVMRALDPELRVGAYRLFANRLSLEAEIRQSPQRDR